MTISTDATAGIDPRALGELRDRIRREVDEGRAPAAQFAMGLHGELVAFEAFGQADTSTLFNVFSCTKAVLGGVVWQLIGEGRLAPETRVVELLPDFGAAGPSAAAMATVTLEHLLTHTAGFPYAPLGPPRWNTREGRLEAFTRWRLTFEPGTRFEYHATSAHWVVAEMLAALEGADHRRVVADRIVEPLGLPSFRLGAADPAEVAAGVAELRLVGEEPTVEELLDVFGTAEIDLGEVTPDILLGFNEPEVRAVGVPGGGGLATAADLALYYQALLHDPEGLWDPAVLADATGHVRCTLPDPLKRIPANRTLGLTVAGDDGGAALRGMGHRVSPAAFGHNGAAGQIAWADPATGLSFAFTTSGVERNFLREGRRTAGIASRAAACVEPR